MVSCAAPLICPSPSGEVSLHAGGGNSVKAGPGLEGEGPPTREEEEGGEEMQANPAYLPMKMSYKSQESKYINVSS